MSGSACSGGFTDSIPKQRRAIEHTKGECVLTFRHNQLFCSKISWRKPQTAQLSTLPPKLLRECLPGLGQSTN